MSYIGVPLPRANAKRLLAGRGQYVDDVRLPRMLHAAFVRSPHAHARIARIDTSAAAGAPGVARILTGVDVAALCRPYVGVLAHIAGMRSAPQYPLAIDIARWQGEPVALALAGAAGASAAILNAVNDALKPLGARVLELPITPERILRALAAPQHA